MLLKELLKSKGIKQKWVASRLGVSEVTVSKWCSGSYAPNAKNIKKLSEVLNVPMKTLVNI